MKSAPADALSVDPAMVNAASAMVDWQMTSIR